MAKKAEKPKNVVERAGEIMVHLEKSHANLEKDEKTNGIAKQANDYQLSFFQLNDPLLEQIKENLAKTDINTLTPVEALMKLNDIKKLIGGK